MVSMVISQLVPPGGPMGIDVSLRRMAFDLLDADTLVAKVIAFPPDLPPKIGGRPT